MTDKAEPLAGRTLQASLTVKDLAASVRFYTEVLGFTAERRVERDGVLRGMAMAAGEARVILNQDDGAKGWERVKGLGMSFNVTTTQDLDAMAAGIKARGGVLEVEPRTTPYGMRLFRVLDLDGFRWTISNPRPA